MATPDLLGKKLGSRYLLEEEISSGGMATVWRARDEMLGRQVAVKILHDQLSSDDDLLERFRLEAIASARLGHPAVVRLFDTGVDGRVSFIVMELFRGETVGSLLERRGPLPSEEAVRIISGALAGLGHAHATGIVHRDVKPANILIGEDGSVKVTDFGIAKAAFASVDLTTTGNLLGTAKYLAPEQAEGEGTDARSDLYSAGVVLYELLTGRPPFDAGTHIATATMRLTKDPAPPRSLRPDISQELDDAVMKSLARDPAERFQDADEMSSALDRALATVRPPRTPRGERPPRQKRKEPRPPAVFRSWVYVPLALVILAGLVVLGYVLVRELGGGNGNGNGNRNRGGTDPESALRIVGAVDFDPLGDNSESPDDAPLAADGDTDTAWGTEGYDQRDFGGLKDGVGIYFDLGRSREMGAVRLVTSTPGWRFRLATADDVSGLAEAIAGAEDQDDIEAEGDQLVELEPVTARYVLLWITDLVEADGWRASVAEIELFPPSD